MHAVNASRVIGRLTSVPNYDDCVYFLKAERIIDRVEKEGWGPALAWTARQQLHAPYSVLLATAAFLVSGGDDAAPYYCNVLTIALVLGAIWWCMRGLPAELIIAS
jgi:hypothetical protein